MGYQSQFKLMLEKIRAGGSVHDENKLRAMYTQNFAKTDIKSAETFDCDLYSMETFTWNKFFPNEVFPGVNPGGEMAPSVKAESEHDLFRKLSKVNELLFDLIHRETTTGFRDMLQKLDTRCCNSGEKAQLILDIKHMQDAAVLNMDKKFHNIKANCKLMQDVNDKQEEELASLRRRVS